MSDALFENREHEPLASRMRPQTLDEYVGQEHIVGKGRLLRRAIAADQLTSVIFYGPPGTGKTTLARVIANHTSSAFITLNAVLTGVADIRDAIKNAEQQRNLYSRKTILFVDEVHRWNKSQQDALLPWVENGTIILIGATTENPFFEVNKALVSRSRVFQLKSLTNSDLMKAAHQVLKNKERGYGNYNVEFEEGALEHLVETANGDCRSLLNALELAVETTPEKWPAPYGEKIYISRETAEESIQKKVILYDRDGDYHYDIISAFIKSLRGRDPDAACYWLARMVKAGEEPHFIFRRMLISACEDTGLADPHAISVVEDCAAAFDRVGLPEGRYFLAHAALYLSTAPKSNSSMAFFDALSSVEKEDADVPNHLKDGSRDAEGFGHGKGYMYPHAYRDHWVAQQYLPSALMGRVFYNPTTQGYEAKIREEVLSRREAQLASFLSRDSLEWWESGSEKTLPEPEEGASFGMHPRPEADALNEENLTFTPESSKKNAVLDKAERQWKARIDSNRAELLSKIRSELLSAAPLLRHSRALVWNADDALLIFDICRKVPEGAGFASCRSQAGLEVLKTYAANLEELDRPQFALALGNAFENNNFEETCARFGDVQFDRVYMRDVFFSADDIKKSVKIFKSSKFLSSESKLLISQRIPCKGQRLSEILFKQLKFSFDAQDSALAEKFMKFEDEFFDDKSNELFSWDENSIKKEFENNGFSAAVKTEPFLEKRRLSKKEILRWFDKENSSYGKKIAAALTDEGAEKIKNAMLDTVSDRIVTWHILNAFFCISFSV